MMKFGALFFALLLGFSAEQLTAQNYFPEVGSGALHQRIQDLKGNLHVLTIALQPGFEDLAALAYFRMSKGAKVTSVYATNGETGENDVERVYPLQLAATRREEAREALQVLNGETYFLNLPDIAAAASMAEIRELWLSDSVQYRLMKVISQVRPDIILLSRDQESEGPSLRWTALLEDVERSVERLTYSAEDEKAKELPPFPRWIVSRVLVDDGTGKGLAVPTGTSHPVWKKTYDAIGKVAAERYTSLSLQRREWSTAKGVRYRVVVPAGTKKLRVPDEGLPEASPRELKEISQHVEKIAKSAERLRPEQASARPSAVLTQLADAVEAVDMRLARGYNLPSRERKILLDWKEGLENLRLTLLGVTVSFTMPLTAVTHLQLVYFSIDSVSGLSDSGTTEIYFPAVGRELILNEELVSRVPLKRKEEYRLLFREVNSFNSPHWIFGLEDNTLGRPLYVFIIHKAKRREENFVHRTIIPMEYVPRLMPEVLTPIVRAIPNERLAFRIVNNSRDGIRDVFHANDSAVVSSKSQFRLNEKGAVHEDTLVLNWAYNLPEGSHILPLKIGEQAVESYVARSFPVEVDSSKRIGFVEGVASSPVRDAFRRLGIKAVDVRFSEATEQRLSQFNVIVLDRRALTVHPELLSKNEVFKRFVENGGHVVILAQDAKSWNMAPLVPGITLKRSLAYSVATPVTLDSMNAVFLYPNKFTEEDWTNWLYRQSFNSVSLGGSASLGVLVRDSATNNPMVVAYKHGKGQYTYIDMDLDHQLLNIHAGAFRLLANMLAR